jgi:ABC-type Fe3+-hydroxamate transport system substrate-binding protein
MRAAFQSCAVHLPSPLLRHFLLILAVITLCGCRREVLPAASPAKAPTVASLVPAATDLLVGMGAGDHLVAVSNYDQPRKETASLPRVGDYRTFDWEKIAELKPAIMIVQFRPDKMPAGLEDRATRYGIRLVNVKINRLDDVFSTLTQLGDAVGEAPKAQRAAADLHKQLDAVRARVAGLPRVRTYIARTDDPLQACGVNNFMDDLLTIAGGENVLAGNAEPYPAIDREQLLTLKPDAVLNLLPGASPQSMEKAKQFWSAAPKVPAIENDRIYYLTEDYLLWPGLNVGNIAERFAEKLHPGADRGTTIPATQKSTRTPPPLPPEEGRGEGAWGVVAFRTAGRVWCFPIKTSAASTIEAIFTSHAPSPLPSPGGRGGARRVILGGFALVAEQA